MFKIDGDLQFFKDDRFSSGNANLAKTYEHILSTNILREKRRDLFDPQRENLLGKESMVNLRATPRVKVFFYYMLAFLSHVLDRDMTRSSGNKML